MLHLIALQVYSFAGFEDIDVALRSIQYLWRIFTSGAETSSLTVTKTVPNPHIS
jgi:hypothetical protein